jgi:hypothetical protein
VESSVEGSRCKDLGRQGGKNGGLIEGLLEAKRRLGGGGLDLI